MYANIIHSIDITFIPVSYNFGRINFNTYYFSVPIFVQQGTF